MNSSMSISNHIFCGGNEFHGTIANLWSFRWFLVVLGEGVIVEFIGYCVGVVVGDNGVGGVGGNMEGRFNGE